MNGHFDPLISSLQTNSPEHSGLYHGQERVQMVSHKSRPPGHFSQVYSFEGNGHEHCQGSSQTRINNAEGNSDAHSHGNDHKAMVANTTNSQGGNHHHNQQQPYMGSDKKFKSYKLVGDPCLTKCGTKLYRYDGVVPSKDPPIVVRDPRRPPASRSHAWNQPTISEMQIPRFKIDKNYTGVPPAIEVSITNLNDNINKSFLTNMLRKFDNLEEIEIFYHPKTNKHLGLAKILFMTSSGAKACVQKLNQTSVMGNIINVFLDPFGKEINAYYEAIVNPPANSEISSFLDPNNMEKLNSNLAPLSSGNMPDFSFLTDGSHLSSEFMSNLNASSSFDSQNTLNSTTTQEQYYNDQQSPVRESLDARIEKLLNLHRVGLGSSFLAELDIFSDENMKFNHNSSGYRRGEPRDRIDESDAILGTPPSPFMSASEYLKWNKITKEIDSGRDPDLCSDEERDDDRMDIDDDRMSLSSLSSGGKLEEAAPAASAFSNNNGHLQAMGIWKPDATGSSFLGDKNPAFFNGGLMPQFMYQSFVPPSGAHHPHTFGLFPGFSVPSALGILPNMCVPNQPSSNHLNHLHNQQNFPHKSSSELLLNSLVSVALKRCIKDLKEILSKDILKKIVENFSYSMFDKWWEEAEVKSKSNENKCPNTLAVVQSVRRSEIHIPLFKPLFESSLPNHQEATAANLEFGVARSLRAAMPKMPSFKKKFVKKSPLRTFSDKLSDISDDEDEDDSRWKRIDRRRKRRRSISSDSRSSHSSSSSRSSRSSRSSSSSLSSSSSRSVSSSTSSTSSEDSESSESSSESSEYSDTEQSDSSSSSILSRVSSNSNLSRASSLSKTSLVSYKKTPSPKTNLIQDVQKDMSDISEEEHDDSETSSAEETHEMEEDDIYQRKTVLSQVQLETDTVNDTTHLTTPSVAPTEREREASQALLGLSCLPPHMVNHEVATPMSDSNQIAQIDFEKSIQVETQSKTDHTYCLPDSTKIKNKKISKERTEKKRNKKDEVQPVDGVDTSLFAVASEWRNAKRKTIAADVTDLLLQQILEPVIEPVVEPEPAFSKRDTSAELAILYDFLYNGIDTEDIGYLKRSYEQLLQTEKSNELGKWLNKVCWIDHPATHVAAPKKRRRLDDSVTRVHSTGCARTEGYYKLDSSEKIKYSHVTANCSDVASGQNNDARARQMTSTQQLTREARSNQRRLLAAVDASYSDLLKFNQLRFRKKQLTFNKSRIHDWGLFAMEPIAADEMVIEYVGQQVRPIVADLREVKYSKVGIGSSYLFKIDSENIVDATRCGNVARFINHSCNPNCYAKVITVEGQRKIVIYSKQQINVGDEITYDYKFPIEENKIVCLCGAPQCRRYLN